MNQYWMAAEFASILDRRSINYFRRLVMICKQCGNEVAPNEKFCGTCGAPNDAAFDQSSQPQYAQPAQSAQPRYGQAEQPQYGQPAQPQYGQPAQPQYGQPVQPQYGQPVQPQYGQYTQDQLASSVLKFGILGLVFSMLIPLLGIIFSSIAMSKAKNYALVYPLEGKAKTGRILGIVGLILSIVTMVITFFYYVSAV